MVPGVYQSWFCTRKNRNSGCRFAAVFKSSVMGEVTLVVVQSKDVIEWDESVRTFSLYDGFMLLESKFT